jgi:hypothetical protein
MRFVALLGSLALLGCFGDDDGGDVDLTEGCDIRGSSCQRAVFDEVVRLKPVADARQPRVQTIDVEQYEQLLRDILVDDPAAEASLAAWGAALRLLGLLSPGADLADASVQQMTGQTVAFYDSRSGEVSVIDRGEVDPMQDAFVLAHEYVHALQDQDVDLQAFREAWAISTDSSLALTALVEGEATVVSAGYLDENLGPDLMLNWLTYGSGIRDNVLEAIDDSDEPLLTAIDLLPYTLGTSALDNRFRDDGVAGIAPLFEVPPQSLLEWVHDLQDEPGQATEPLDCYPTSGPEGFEIVDHDTLGMVGQLAIAVRAGETAEFALTVAGTWANDSLVLFRDEQDEDSFAVAWRLRAQSDVAAGNVAQRLDQLQTGATLVQEGQELLVYAATDPAVASSWSSVTDCGVADDLPASEDSLGDMMTTRASAALRARTVSPRARR